MNSAPPAKREGTQVRHRTDSLRRTCEHQATVTQQEPTGRTHFSKEVCIICGAFVRWLPKPVNVERKKLNSFRLARLTMRPDLSVWERQFIRSVSQRNKVSPKQQQIIERLVRQYMGGDAP